MQKEFRIDGSGKSQVTSHAKCHSSNTKRKNAKEVGQNQRILEVNSGNVNLIPKTNMVLSSEDKVFKAEILQALHVVKFNYSFGSTQSDSKHFQIFPDSLIAQSYSQSETEVKYNLQFGIAPYCKKKPIYDVANSPSTFKFDDTTNNQVKKQYDGYLQYWSKRQNKVVNRYCGSLFWPL